MDDAERRKLEKEAEEARWKQLMAGMQQMGLDQKTHAEDMTETLGDININMATINANVHNIKEKSAEDRKELRESISKVHERIDPLNGQVQANKQSLVNQDKRIGEIGVKANNNEDRIVRIESSTGLEAPKEKTNGLTRLQFWAIIIGAVVTLGTAVIGAYVTIRTADKPSVVVPENPE